MDIKRIVLESNNEEETDYFVSSDGRIFKEITPSKNGNGYAMVTIYKNGIGYTKSVHRIVAKAFLQKVKGKEYINHINGDKMDNRLENLEWCTPHENTEHYHKTLRNGKPMYNQKACLQIIDGEVIAEYKRLSECKIGAKHHFYGKHLSKEHSQKIGNANKNGKCSIPVVQLDLDGNFVNEYPSTNEAERQTGIHHGGIWRAVKKHSTAGGYRWIYKRDYKP